MAETIRDKQVFSLLEVAQSIQKTIAERYKSVFWVKAEMNKLNHYSHSGHCYPELVEKRDGKVIALMKSTLWKSDYFRINAAFLSILKEPLKDGIKILFSASITFDPTHGLSLNILDIDPSFSLGELEREKQETLERLAREGIFNLNQRLPFPVLPQRVAIISVETSKGYADYLKIMEDNPWRYKFFNYLFPSLLQGEKSVASIIHQLRRIRKVLHHFDVVAIIRGGGGDVGLSSFNNYELAREIALFPIPVLTGIGHSTNETVTEMVAHRNAITPTELADFLIHAFRNFETPVLRAEELIVDRAQRLVRDERLRLNGAIKYFLSVTHNRLQRSRHDVENQSKSLVQQSRFLLKQQEQTFDFMLTTLKRNATDVVRDNANTIDTLAAALQRQATNHLQTRHIALRQIEKHVSVLDPINILKRGFTITLKDGKAVKDSTTLNPGDTVVTRLAEGEVTSTITQTTFPQKKP
ncbi:exodeoxyribonuclease VII large subunit [Chryseolinea lacunae]|uniref:Exodeoxyribonuclease 7 large subunit n=1 Tax=Chryseolinea lacunae TaxID=2801331 RepID=A0ABS1KPG7_9BACT|nr:exodeoxyribonuclease VII large subunit [Chryseolinea lacunae]MBL0741230.1 exodeoxyribonuclease VII large subunit [Chryseolinea lacunae]